MGRGRGRGASRRDRTNGQTHITAGPRSLDASRRTVSVATNSSPQLAGTATVNPRRRHACANCTGVAGAASSTASLPMIATIDTGRRSAVGRGADMVRRSCCSKQAPNTRRVQTEQTLQTCNNRLMHASYEVAGCCTETPRQATTWRHRGCRRRVRCEGDLACRIRRLSTWGPSRRDVHRRAWADRPSESSKSRAGFCSRTGARGRNVRVGRTRHQCALRHRRPR